MPPKQTPLNIVYRPVDKLVPYARNARTHSEPQVSQIAGSIKEFGFTNPVLIDESGGIIAGHGRVLAARKLDMTEVPTITLTGLTETQRRAYILADNRLALNAGWDAELLSVELQALVEDNFDATMLGFEQNEVENLLAAFRAPVEGEEDAEPWDGMPSFGTEPRAHRSIIVHCQDEAAVADFARRMGQQLTDKTKYIYHPFKPKEDRQSQAWVDEEDDDGEGSEVSDLHPE